MLVAPLWEESVSVKTCYGINTQTKQKTERGHAHQSCSYSSTVDEDGKPMSPNATEGMSDRASGVPAGYRVDLIYMF